MRRTNTPARTPATHSGTAMTVHKVSGFIHLLLIYAEMNVLNAAK